MGLSPQERLLLQHFEKYISEHKKRTIQQVLAQRTRHVTVVLEDIFQSQNASAAIRTCECMGLQDVHIVEDTCKYQVNTQVIRGANKWMNLKRYRAKSISNIEVCFNTLRSQGYHVYTTDPAPDGISIDEIDPVIPCAIVFGNELNGVSDYALNHCDQKVKIPMYGFTESLNISVSVAICLNTLITKLRHGNWCYGLSNEECEVLTLHWYKKIVRRSDLIEREFLRTIQ
jgi:tRNA (guanosine-2'-O-)-methyltransferase